MRKNSSIISYDVHPLQMIMLPVRSKSNQIGAYYELPLIGVTLFLVGAVLGTRHAEYFLLCVIGLGAVFMPFITHYLKTAPNRARMLAAVKELGEGGFVTGYLLPGPEFDVALAFEPGTDGNFAWITMEDMYVRKKTDIVMIKLVAVDRTRPGGMKHIVHTLRVSAEGDSHDFGQPLRWFARKKLGELKKFVAPSTVLTEQ